MVEEANLTKKKTLGNAIDEIIASLEPLDEPSRKIAINAVCEKLAIDFSERAAPGRISSAGQADGPKVKAAFPTPSTAAPVDIRTFAQEKKPRTVVERVVLVAYYLSEQAPPEQRKAEIDKEDITRYFKQAGFPLPKRPEQALVNARHAGYLNRLGEGRYRLNAVGHNLVAHNLPRGGEPAARGARRRASRQRRRGTKS